MTVERTVRESRIVVWFKFQRSVPPVFPAVCTGCARAFEKTHNERDENYKKLSEPLLGLAPHSNHTPS